MPSVGARAVAGRPPPPRCRQVYVGGCESGRHDKPTSGEAMAHLCWIDKSATDLEAAAAIELARLLPEDWSIVCNKTLWTNYARSFEVDMIIVGAHGIYLVDEKSWRGPVVCGPEYWQMAGGQRKKSPLNKVEDAARVLSGHLRKRVTGLQQALGGNFLTYGFVLFSRGETELNTENCPAPDRILRLAQAADALRSFDGFRGQQGSDIQHFSADIVKWLVGEDTLVLPPGEVATTVATGARQRTRLPWLVAIAVLVASVAAVAWVVSTDDSLPPPEEQPVVVPWNEAYRHLNEMAEVEGPVMDVEQSGGATFINLGKEFRASDAPDKTRFYALIPQEYDPAFRRQLEDAHGDGALPSDVFGGHVVRIRGRITESQSGEPYIRLTSVEHVEIVE